MLNDTQIGAALRANAHSKSLAHSLDKRLLKLDIRIAPPFMVYDQHRTGQIWVPLWLVRGPQAP